MLKSTRMFATHKYFDPGFKNNPVKESLWDRLPEDVVAVIKNLVEQQRYAKVIQRAYRRVRYSPMDFPGYKDGTRSNEPELQRCVIYCAAPAHDDQNLEIRWYTRYVVRAPRKGCKYAAVVSKGGWDREHYYSDPEFRKEAKKISPNLGRIIRMFLIKP